MKLGADQLDDLALGAVFLATGGGGDPYIPLLIAKQALQTFGPVEVIKPEQLPDDALVVTIGGVGAPTVSLELLASLDEAPETLRAYERHIGRKADAVASFEIGGGNSLVPLVAAAGCGLPVIDGDGMGRALPEAQMMSYAIAGVKATPALARDYAGKTTSFEADTTEDYERAIRAFTAASGGMATAAEHPMTGAELKRSIIPETLSFSIELGRVMREHKGPAETLLPALQDLFAPSIYQGCELIHIGKVIDKSTRVVGGYDVGEVTIEAFDRASAPLTVDIKNEYLLARRGNEAIVSVPDLITIVDHETCVPINAERLRYGQRVAVFAVGAPALYRTDRALAVVAPRCFGFDFDYLPFVPGSMRAPK